MRDKIQPQEMKWSSRRKHRGVLSVSELEKMKLEQRVRQGNSLVGIIIDGADLRGANLKAASLEKASRRFARSLTGTILIDVEGLTQEQIEFARSRGSKVSDN